MSRRTGYVFAERFLWHDPGSISFSKWVEPGEPWENKETKRRMHSLLDVSGLLSELVPISPRSATREEITRFHTVEYHDRIVHESGLDGGGDGGELARFAQGGYEIAALSAGGVLAACEEVKSGRIENAYCLVRPPGHHAIKARGMGFCIFSNVALAALHCKLALGWPRVAIVDYDVHHGNGTQDCFWNDPDVLFISLHQADNYPQQTGALTEVGGPDALGTTINIPLPPGSGSGCYAYAFDTVVIPALHRFKPDIILVSSGFDASDADPLGSMMLSSQDFKSFTEKMLAAAKTLCGGRIVFAHEGGYSKDYVPFCGLAVLEALSGHATAVVDPYLDEIRQRGYQDLQPHQAALVDAAASLAGLSKTAAPTPSAELSPHEQTTTTSLKHVLESMVQEPARQRAILSALLENLN